LASESELSMQQIISKKQLWEKLGQLNPLLQQTVIVFIDSLLETQTTVDQRDKRRLLALSVWNDEDVQRIEEAQDRVNAWQLPAY
jgi:hypothetical protein